MVAVLCQEFPRGAEPLDRHIDCQRRPIGVARREFAGRLRLFDRLYEGDLASAGAGPHSGRRNRAGAPSVLIYWMANPVLNPAALVFIGFVLGWQWAALRLIVGVALVFVLANLAARFVSSDWRPRGLATGPDDSKGPFILAWGRAILRLSIRLLPEYLILVFALGMTRAWFFPAMTPDIGHAAWLAPVLAAAGTLFVIPTAGEVPIIQVLQQFGLGSSGAAALLVTLPAVSLPSLAMLARSLPLRAILVLGVGTFGFGLVAAGAVAVLGF